MIDAFPLAMISPYRILKLNFDAFISFRHACTIIMIHIGYNIISINIVVVNSYLLTKLTVTEEHEKLRTGLQAFCWVMLHCIWEARERD